MSGHGRALSLRSAVAFGVLLCVGFSIPASASAAELSFLETFGAANEPSFTEAEGVAVDQSTGDLLVIDGEANTVSRWNPDGTAAEFSALGTNVIDGSETPEGELAFGSAGEVQIAVDNSGTATDGNIYVPQAGAKVVDIFASTGEFLGQLTESSEGAFAEPCGVAVDPAGNVYLGDFSGAIHKYEPAANPPVNGDSSANFAFPSNCTLAAGAGPTDGFIFAAHFNGSVAKLDSATGAEEYEFASGETTTLSVDPTSGHVFVAQGAEIKEFDASGASATELPPPISLASAGQGVAANGSTGNVYATRAGETHVEVFAPGPPEGEEFELKIDKAGAGTGTVTSSPAGIDCGSECSALFEEGREVELEAAAASNSEFTGWSTVTGNPGTCTGTISPCEVTMSEAVELKAEFELLPPAVTALNPTKGPIGGSNPVEITGTNLSEATKVEFGTSEVTCPSVDCTLESSTTIQVNAPAHAAGTVDVRVTGPGGPSANTAADDYTYIEVPAVTAVSPSKGSTAGGNQVEITGTNLAEATKVEFGTTVVEAPFTENLATKIKVDAPGHSAGTVDVRVTTVGGTSASAEADNYTYIATPAVTALNPTKGPTAGGNQVEITGLRLAGASKVEFGTTVVEESEFIENTATTIKVNAPAHEPGKVHVRVTTLGGTSLKFSSDEYTYEGPTSLAINKAGTGSGSVSCNGGACASTYPFGSKVTLAATASSGSSFAGWSGGGCSGTGSCVVTMNANTTVTATFNANPVPPPPPPPGTPEVASKASFSGGKVALKMTCNGPGACDGTVTLKAKIKGKNKVIGSASFSVGAGETKTIKVKITNNVIKEKLKEGKTVTATLSGPNLSGKVKLKKS